MDMASLSVLVAAALVVPATSFASSRGVMYDGGGSYYNPNIVERLVRLNQSSGDFDTLIMEAVPRLFVKTGAEGVYCAALPELGLGVAIKMDDGNNARACEVALAAVLQKLLRAEGADQAHLSLFSDAALKNWNGIEVGRLRATAFI